MEGTGFGIIIVVIILVMTFSQVLILANSQKNRHKEIMDELAKITEKLAK